MKTKFLCLCLSIMMLMALLTGCAAKEKSLDDMADQEVRQTKTLVLYLMSEDKVSARTTSEIEDEINKLTKAKFKTQLDIHYFTEDEYYTELEKKFKGKETENKKAEKELNDKRKKEKWLRESCKQAGISYIPATTPAPSTEITEEATLVNEEYGTIEYVYPEPKENQVDFFYVGGYNKYNTYIDEEWIASLDEELATSSKKLKEHIPELYMKALSKAGIYGIPNNSIIGEYTWMLLDKKLMDRYFFTEDSINNYTDDNYYKFLSDVYKYETDYLPIKGTPEILNVYYWTIDPDNNRLTNQPSLMAGFYDNSSNVGYNLSVNTIFHSTSFRNQVTTMKKLELAGYYGTEADQDKPFASAFIKGGYDIYEQYSEDYYVKMLARPRADYDDIYGNMFCVSALEDSVARSMEIVTYINTNSTVRNILQYGIEDENYYIDDYGVLHRYNDTYMMDINKTGNVFMAHPEEGLPEDFWDVGVRQNADAYMVPTFGFQIEYDANVDTERIKKFQDMYPEYMAQLDACKSVDEINAVFNTALAAFAEKDSELNKDYNFVKNTSYLAKDDNDLLPVATIYMQWLIDNGYFKV